VCDGIVDIDGHGARRRRRRDALRRRIII